MTYAVNLCNLLSLKELDPVGSLLFPPDILGEVVNPGRRQVGHDAVILDVEEERADAILELIRRKYKKEELMMYRSKTGKGSWKRV